MKCECGSTRVVVTVSDYVCTRCGGCLGPVFDADNGHEKLEPLHPLGTVIDHRGNPAWARFKRHNGRPHQVGDDSYLRLCRSCQTLGLSTTFALQAIGLYRWVQRRQPSSATLAPACLWQILRQRHLGITRDRLVASFDEPQLSARALFRALQRYDFPEVHR
jgi:hypothetical protein